MAVKSDPVKGTYQHFKGGFYEMLGIAEDPETGKRYVVYEALGLMENLQGLDKEGNPTAEVRVIDTSNKGALAVCSIERFTELVDGAPYHPGQRLPRFRLVVAAPSRLADH